jgi:hypothetical protein
MLLGISVNNFLVLYSVIIWDSAQYLSTLVIGQYLSLVFSLATSVTSAELLAVLRAKQGHSDLILMSGSEF